MLQEGTLFLTTDVNFNKFSSTLLSIDQKRTEIFPEDEQATNAFFAILYFKILSHLSGVSGQTKQLKQHWRKLNQLMETEQRSLWKFAY
jgi:hypothetical protein